MKKEFVNLQVPKEVRDKIRLVAARMTAKDNAAARVTMTEVVEEAVEAFASHWLEDDNANAS